MTLFVALLGFLASAATGSKDFLPIDCNDIYCHDNTSCSGVYSIFPGDPTTPLQVYCDMHTDGGRWTVSISDLITLCAFLRPCKPALGTHDLSELLQLFLLPPRVQQIICLDFSFHFHN